ncbi:flagellar hook-length control protein FliK [Mesobacterium pallidum]|uniref:flagellar hook-length control protein FliK n=1 Tax=Mesobacterium pallidum TaxID=2872037 RepID=UPI001EE19977|nr:flagellar hook-length control protein FliK [Mesobacterium pallidum]
MTQESLRPAARPDPGTRPELVSAAQTQVVQPRNHRIEERAVGREAPAPNASSPSAPPLGVAASPVMPMSTQRGTGPQPVFALESTPIERDIADNGLAQDLRGSDGVTLRQGQQAQADMSRHIGRQMAEALAKPGERPVEISLSPAELGKVRLNMHTTEHSVMVTITAERPETLELMRRHIDQLAQEFKQLGYSDITFSFRGGQSDNAGTGGDPGSDGSSHRTGSETANAPPATEPSTALPGPSDRTAADGLDLRL